MTGTGVIGKTTNRGTTVTKAHTQAERETMWGPIDGEIVDYDAAKGTATIKPLYKPLVHGKPVDMPNLLEVPMRFPNAGDGGAMTFPIPAGTLVKLTPGMRNSENYHTENDGSPFDMRSFSINDMEASLIGGESLTKPMPNVDPSNMHIRANKEGTYGIRMSPGGQFALEGAQGNAYDLIAEAIGLCEEGFTLLGEEPSLVHQAQYAALGEQIGVIASKLFGMTL